MKFLSAYMPASQSCGAASPSPFANHASFSFRCLAGHWFGHRLPSVFVLQALAQVSASAFRCRHCLQDTSANRERRQSFNAAVIRREALQRVTGRSLQSLQLEGFDYESILVQCCEMPVGFVKIPVGVAGPLLLDGFEYTVPMATTEGCLMASTNRGCKAIYVSGGASSVVLKDGMSRAPVVRFSTAKRAVELKFFLEDPLI